MFDEAGREILARLRHASKRGSRSDLLRARDALPTAPAATLLSEELPLAFLARVLAQGGSCAVANGRRAAVDAIGSFVGDRHGQRRVVAGHDPRLAALPWRDGGVLPRFGCAESGDSVAVSYASTAVAETGSVLLWRSRDNPASNNLLAEDHIVLVDESALVARLEEAWSAVPIDDPARRPHAGMLISGPSSTGDIELKLVLGAHGPRCWHVVLLGSVLDPQLPARARDLAAGVAGSAVPSTAATGTAARN